MAKGELGLLSLAVRGTYSGAVSDGLLISRGQTPRPHHEGAQGGHASRSELQEAF